MQRLSPWFLKRLDLGSLGDFRPISCCNVLYKCILKIIANHLCVWLPHFINLNQSAFVKGRSIVDNILLCKELVRGYHRIVSKSRCLLKVDFQKAYDSIHWDFLFGLRFCPSIRIRVDVFLSFCEGGLSIRYIPSWNVVAIGKLLWLILISYGSMWVVWMEAYSLWGRSIWAVRASSSSSWCWKVILRVHDSLRPLVRFSIGNGRSCLVWYNLWLVGALFFNSLVLVLSWMLTAPFILRWEISFVLMGLRTDLPPLGIQLTFSRKPILQQLGLCYLAPL